MEDAQPEPTDLSRAIDDPELRLSCLEKRCIRLWAWGLDAADIVLTVFSADLEDMAHRPLGQRKDFTRDCLRRVEWALDRAGKQITKHHPEVWGAGWRHARDIGAAAANGQENGRTPEVRFGFAWWVHIPERVTFKELREMRANPRLNVDIETHTPIAQQNKERLRPSRLTTIRAHAQGLA
jgi:hypothetical protein